MEILKKGIFFMVHNVGIGKIVVSTKPEDVFKTILGSCVALTMYSKSPLALGMAHVALPDSITNPYKARQNPGFFADTAVYELLRSMLALNIYNNHGLEINLYGGARVFWENNTFCVGQRNLDAIRDILMFQRLKYNDAETGGIWGMSVEVDVLTGVAKIIKRPIKWSAANKKTKV
jgi:chemotaxis protein CheD